MEEEDDNSNTSNSNSNRIPNVIYVQEKTLLTRWEPSSTTAAATKDTAEWDDLSSNSSLLSDLDGAGSGHTSNRSAQASNSSPRVPRRTPSPPPRKKRTSSYASGHDKAKRKLREDSHKSGIDIEQVPLELVKRGVPTSSDRDSTSLLMMETTSPMTTIDNLPSMGKVTAVFAIRREGCPACRYYGRQLTQLAEHFKGDLKLFGIVKKAHNSSDGELERFYENYFNFPIYQDDNNWSTFQFLGNRKISVWKTLRTSRKMIRMLQTNKLETGMWGDHFTQGGILLFDTKGQLRYVYYERFSDELDITALTWAIQNCLTHDQPSPIQVSVAPPRQPVRCSSNNRLVVDEQLQGGGGGNCCKDTTTGGGVSGGGGGCGDVPPVAPVRRRKKKRHKHKLDGAPIAPCRH